MVTYPGSTGQEPWRSWIHFQPAWWNSLCLQSAILDFVCIQKRLSCPYLDMFLPSSSEVSWGFGCQVLQDIAPPSRFIVLRARFVIPIASMIQRWHLLLSVPMTFPVHDVVFSSAVARDAADCSKSKILMNLDERYQLTVTSLPKKSTEVCEMSEHRRGNGDVTWHHNIALLSMLNSKPAL